MLKGKVFVFTLIGLATLLPNRQANALECSANDGYEIKDTYLKTGDKEYRKSGTTDYDQPKVSYLGGTIYDRDLEPEDFFASQDYTYDTYKNIYEVTEFEYEYCDDERVKKGESITRDGGDGNVTSNTSNNISFDISGSSIVNGIKEFDVKVTMNGRSKNYNSGRTYWVKDVELTSNDSNNSRTTKSLYVQVDCSIVYGNDLTKDCSKGDPNKTESERLSLKTYMLEEPKFLKEVTSPKLQNFMDSINQSLSWSKFHQNRINQIYLPLL